MAQPTGNWIFMMKKGATEAQTAALAQKIDALGKDQGFKTLDYFHGTLLVKSDEAFAKKVEQQFANELEKVAKETFIPRPDTRPKIRKPPGGMR